MLFVAQSSISRGRHLSPRPAEFEAQYYAQVGGGLIQRIRSPMFLVRFSEHAGPGLTRARTTHENPSTMGIKGTEIGRREKRATKARE